MISSLELARLCGVSQGTVDRALHNRGRISDKTRARILAMAEKHGYAPNPAAREVMTGRSTIVGAIAPALSSVFFMDLMEKTRAELREQGCQLFITPSDSSDETVSLVRELAARRSRAVMLFSPPEGLRVPREITRSLPVVALINPCTTRTVRSVVPDEQSAGQVGVDYLVSRGHRRIMFLSYARRSWAMVEREVGYDKAMANHGLEPCLVIEPTGQTLAEAVQTYRPTAVFCHNDWLALWAMRHLGEMGLRVPADLSVLGIDNSPTFVSLCPDITTLAYPADAVAHAAVQAIAGERIPNQVGTFNVVERHTVATPQTM